MSNILRSLPLRVKISGFCLSLMLLASCATPDSTSTALPAETSFNRAAGRGDYLFVTVRLRNGEALLFALDTGAPVTVFDESLKARLGKVRGNVEAWSSGYGVKSDMEVIRAPALYLGNSRLRMGEVSFTSDLSWVWPGRRVKGILGLDCLQHYCIQLDFKAGKMRFFDPDRVKPEDFGRAMPLTLSDEPDQGLFVDENLMGLKPALTMIDTGMPGDGALETEVFKRKLQDQKVIWTKRYKTGTGVSGMVAMFPKGAFGGETYTNLGLSKSSGRNYIGLGFLARNLVTFNFPKRTIYLKLMTVGPPDSDTREAVTFLSSLKEKGQLPGWPKDPDDEVLMATLDENHTQSLAGSRTFIAPKYVGHSVHCLYHYTVVEVPGNGPWKLQRAWQTDPAGRIVNE